VQGASKLQRGWLLVTAKDDNISLAFPNAPASTLALVGLVQPSQPRALLLPAPGHLTLEA